MLIEKVPFSAIGTCFKLAEFGYHLAEVGPESQVFIRLIKVVRTDLQETERLLSVPTVRKRVERTPHKIEWIKTALHNVRFALNEIGRWVEDARVDKQSKGSVQLQTRLRWVFQDHAKVTSRSTELSVCHSQLSNVLAYLVPLEEETVEVVSLSETGEKSIHVVVAPRQRRKSRPMKQMADCNTSENPDDGMFFGHFVAWLFTYVF